MTDEIFQPFPKIPRLKRGCIITEKIDGTNAQIYFPPTHTTPYGEEVPNTNGDVMYVGSRKRLITPEHDNYGFARWAYEHQTQLFQELGHGRHFGEWWGAGIQRRYGQQEKHFSLFNTMRFDSDTFELCRVVPVLYKGDFSTDVAQEWLDWLEYNGSVAAPGFMDPEGIVIYMPQARQLFKQTIDDKEKGQT